MDLFLTKPIFKDTVTKLLIKTNLVKWVSKPMRDLAYFLLLNSIILH